MSGSHHSSSSGSPRQKSPEHHAEHIPMHAIGHQAAHSSTHHTDQPAGHQTGHQIGMFHVTRVAADVHHPPPPPPSSLLPVITGHPHRAAHPLSTRLHLPPPPPITAAREEKVIAASPSSQSMNTKFTNHQLDLLAVNLIKVQEEAIQDWITVYNSFLGLDKGKVVIDSLHPSAEKGVPIKMTSQMKIWHKPSYQYPEGKEVYYDKAKAEALIKRMQEDDPSKKIHVPHN